MKLNIGTLITLAATVILATAMIAGCSDQEPDAALNGDGREMDMEVEEHDGDVVDGSLSAGAEAADDIAAELVEYRNDDGELACLVTGDLIESTEDAFGYQDYEGTRYYFCCTACPALFEADPAKYVVRGEQETDHQHGS